jgi:Zn-dependent protease
MFGRSFRIARIAGIPVNVDASWIWIAVLAVYTLYSRFEGRFDTSGSGALAYAVLGALLFFGSVFFGGFTSARADDRGALPAFAISAFGPATSFALAIVFWLSAAALEGTSGPLPGLLKYLAAINLFMAVFNVLPGLPLDGGRMLQAAVWGITGDRAKGTRVASGGGIVLGVVLFAWAAYEVTQQDLFYAIWLAVIGSFIFQGARTIRQQIGLGERLAAATVADAMEPPPPAVPADLSLSETLDRFLRGHEEEAFPVIDEGRVIGMISFDSARALGSQDPLRPARDAVIPLGDVLTTGPDERLDAVAARLGNGRAALVLRDGALVGAITGRGVSRYVAKR